MLRLEKSKAAARKIAAAIVGVGILEAAAMVGIASPVAAPSAVGKTACKL